MKIEKEDINKVLMVTIATIIYTIGFNTFVSSGNLFPGGFAGLSRLISRILFEFTNINISFGYIYFTLNILLTILIASLPLTLIIDIAPTPKDVEIAAIVSNIKSRPLSY